MLSRRSFLRGAAAAAGAASGIAATSCSAGGADAGGREGGSIAFLDWARVETGTPLSKVLDAFQKSSGVSVDVQPAPGFDNYEAKLLTMMASGKTPDVVRIEDDSIIKYSSQGQLLDLNKYIDRDGLAAADFFDRPFTFPIQDDGKHTAWSSGARPTMILYNVDLFDEAKIPHPPATWSDDKWKWDDFLAAAKKLTVQGKRFGALCFGPAAETVFTVNNGAEGIFSKDHKRFTLADPAATEGLQWVADLTLKHKVQPTWEQMRSNDRTPNYALSMFAQGEIAMMSQSLGAVPWLSNNMKKFRWDIAPVPGHVAQKTLNSFVVWAIPAASKHPDLGWELLKYLTGPEGSREFGQRRDLLPCAKSSEQYLRGDQRPPEHLHLVVDAVANGVNENAGAYVTEARAIYMPQMDLIWTGKKPAADALGAVRQQVDNALAGNR